MIPKGKRKECKFEVFHHALKMRKGIMELVIRNFGLKRKPKEDLLDFDKMVQDNFFEFVERERFYITDILRNIASCITRANKLFPTTLEEFSERRLLQDKAITYCFDLVTELQFCMETLPNIDINGFLRYAEVIQKQILLLKGWRKSDNRLKAGIESNLAKKVKSVKINNGNIKLVLKRKIKG